MSKTKTKSPKSNAGRPRTRPAKDVLYTMIRHDADEKKAWDAAAARMGQQLGIPVSRSAWLRSLANQAAAASTAGATLTLRPDYAAQRSNGYVGAPSTMGEVEPAVTAMLEATVEKPAPKRNPDGSLIDAKPSTGTLARKPSASAIAALRAISTEGASEDVTAVRELRSLGLVDSEGLPTDRGMEYVMS